jgi:hypothetical protein
MCSDVVESRVSEERELFVARKCANLAQKAKCGNRWSPIQRSTRLSYFESQRIKISKHFHGVRSLKRWRIFAPELHPGNTFN